MPDLKRSRTWDGGYIRTDSRGRDVYYIRRRVDGHLYDTSTRATSSAAAHEQLKRFEADPAGYRPGGDLAGSAALRDELVGAFLQWSRNEKGNTTKWVNDQKRALAWWKDQIGETDFRKLRGSELARHLDKAERGRKQYIASLKTFIQWLIRERRAMEASQDPMMGIAVPQSRPEQWITPKTHTLAQFESCREHLPQPWRDCADVLAGTGKHWSELARFVLGTERGQRGAVEDHPQKTAKVLAFPQTKGGEPHKVEVSKIVAAAAGRLLEGNHGAEFDYFEFRKALRAACREAGLKSDTVTPGTFRHTVATHAVNSGDDLGTVSAFLGHKSVQTTRRFYATFAVPAKVTTLK